MIKAAQLFSKELGLAINKAAKIGEFKVPRKAVSFDRITGTGKKGDFEVLRFRNRDGEVIKTGSTFVDEAGNRTHQVRNYYNKNRDIFRTTESVYVNGQEESFTSTALLRVKKKNEANKTISYVKRKQHICGDKEVHSWEFLQSGQKPKTLEYDANWNGRPVEIRMNNNTTPQEISEREFQYLPLFNSDLSTRKINQKFDLLQLIQEKLYGIEGILPKVKKVKFSELNPRDEIARQKKGGMYVFGNASQFTGQVKISEHCQKNSIQLVENFAHEYKHADDFVKFMRLFEPELEKYSKKEMEQFYTILEKRFPGARAFEARCVKAKGIIMPDDKDYAGLKKLQEEIRNYKYTTAAEHDAIPIEVRAIEASKEQLNLLEQLFKKLLYAIAKD